MTQNSLGYYLNVVLDAMVNKAFDIKRFVSQDRRMWPQACMADPHAF